MATYSTGGPGPNRTAPPQAADRTQNKRLEQTQAQVDEVVDIMRVNVEKVLERDQKLSELDNRADALQDGARQFENAATRLKRKYWWKNLKMWLILIAVVVVIIIIIIVAVATSLPASSGGGGGSAGSATTLAAALGASSTPVP